MKGMSKMAEMDMGLSPQKKKKKKKRKQSFFKSIVTGLIPWKGDSTTEIFRKIIFLVSLGILVFAFVLIVQHFMITGDESGGIEGTITTTSGEETTIIALKNQTPTKEQIEKLPEGTVNEEYAALYDANNDFAGWINIQGTNVNYPVMQSHDNEMFERCSRFETNGTCDLCLQIESDPYLAKRFMHCNTYTTYGYCEFCQQIVEQPHLAEEFYLHHDFGRNYLFAGNIFADYQGKISPDQMPNNTILYGHNMLYEYQFSALSNYKQLDFLKVSPVIDFNTLYHDNKYKIFSVFLVNTTDEYGEVFDYYDQVYFANSSEFYNYILECMDRSLFETGVDIEYGDELLTLSTCDESTGFNDMRLVIVARKVRPNENPTVDINKIVRKDSIKYFDAYYAAYGNWWSGRTWDVSLVKGMAEYIKENGLEDPAV
ncbi:MAG: class B sortase [Ruminococcaceae bacterium]|nr:class B sortase [Oscillospiraceae bacterium]